MSKQSDHFTVERSLAPWTEPILEITFHAFGDSNTHGVGTVVYAVVQKESKLTQGIVCAKSRLAKRNLSIPRLELVAGHKAINLATNVRTAINNHPVHVHC